MPNQQVTLRPTQEADLAALFEFQLNEEAAYLAAFMPQDYTDPVAYRAKYRRFLRDPTIHMQTILVDGVLAGSIAKFETEGDAEITYWLARSFWGRGVATAAPAPLPAAGAGPPYFWPGSLRQLRLAESLSPLWLPQSRHCQRLRQCPPGRGSGIHLSAPLARGGPAAL